MHAEDPPPSADDAWPLAWSTWLAGVTAPGAAARLRAQPRPLPDALAHATRDQLAAVGVRYDPTLPLIGLTYVGAGDLSAEHAPGLSHVAIGLTLYEADETFWWVDGQPLQLSGPVPEGALLDSLARWIDPHTLAVSIAQLGHPLDDPITTRELGMARGLLLHDARTRRSVIALPGPQERWEDPRAVRQGRHIAIVGRPDDAAPARVIDAP